MLSAFGPDTRRNATAVNSGWKGYREAFARFFEDPSRERLRDLLRDNFGEGNEFDFKREWPETSKLARHVLGFANFGGGCIIVGVEQEDDGNLTPGGLPTLTDKTEVMSGLDKYLPDPLSRQIQILDFPFPDSGYPKLKGKFFKSSSLKTTRHTYLFLPREMEPTYAVMLSTLAAGPLP